MGRKVVESHEHGDFICEGVEEMPPLGEDRKTIFVPQAPLGKAVSQVEELVYQARGDMANMLALVMAALVERYGDEAWEVVAKAMYDVGQGRGKEFAEVMKIDPEDARSVGRVFDLEDNGIGIKGEWVETGRKRAVKREYYCPLAAGASLCPEICTRLFDAVGRGTLDALGARVKDFHFEKLLPKGDPYCEVVLELEE